MYQKPTTSLTLLKANGRSLHLVKLICLRNMANWEYLNLDSAAYDVFVGGSVRISINERELAILTTMMLLLIERDNWDDMTDAEWEVQEQEVQNILSILDR